MSPLSARLVVFAALLGASGVSLGAPAASAAADPCAKIAGKTFVPPADSLACLKSFPFNETLRQNVLTVVSRVFDFYTFEDYYLKSPPPFQDSTVNIRAELARINRTHYAVREVITSSHAMHADENDRRTTTSTMTCTTSPTS